MFSVIYQSLWCTHLSPLECELGYERDELSPPWVILHDRKDSECNEDSLISSLS